MNIEIYKSLEDKYKGGESMAILAESKITSFTVRNSDARKFIEKTNKNKISKAFLEDCARAADIFKQEKTK